jgi:hypothetical protein
MGRDHAQDEAEKLVRIGLRIQTEERGTGELPGRDERKIAIAESVHRNTTVMPQQLKSFCLTSRGTKNRSPNFSMLIRIVSCFGIYWPLALIGGLDVAPGEGRFYRKDCLCDLCDLLCK